MARRMISDIVAGSDAFVMMPLSAQALYFHFVLECDNKGFFSSAISTARKIGAKKEDIETLIKEGFIIRFPGSPVMCVTHWNQMNNLKEKMTKSDFPESKLVRLDGGIYVMKKDTECEEWN